MGKIWFFSGYDGDQRGNGRDRWVENEDRAKRLQTDEGKVSNADKVVKRTVTDARGRSVQISQDSSLGLHGQDITIYGERATHLRTEIETSGGRPTGDVVEYFQMESGGTRRVIGKKVGPGRHRLIVDRKKYFSF